MRTYREAVLRLARTRPGTAVRGALGPRTVRRIARLTLPSRRVRLGVGGALAAARSRRDDVDEPGAVLTRRGWVVSDPGWQPQTLREDNLARTVAALERAGIVHALLRTDSATRHAVAVLGTDLAAVVSALAQEPGLKASRVRQVDRDRGVGPSRPVPAAPRSGWDGARVLRVYRQVRAHPESFVVGETYGCDVELWAEGRAPGVLEPLELGPRANVAGDALPLGTLGDTEPVEVGGRTYPRPRLLGRRMLEDVDFDVDVVYTWVDGDDPAWRERMRRTKASLEGVPFHPESSAPNRFTSRDELRYSLRSLDAYAPWVRRVWVVVDGQRPGWLSDDTGRLTVVDHRDIVDDPAVLPLFNSNAIISRLHHIPGLAEHYLYLNDDMFFGQDVRPQSFFHASGVARLFPARLHRPFGPATSDDEPHVNLSRNIRELLEQEFGITTTRAIRHTPYPQLRSRHEELERIFPEAYARVLEHPFRHHEDIAPDQLLHYYLQVVGAGVPSTITYDYVNVGVAEERHRLRRLLVERDRAVFCLNDAPAPGRLPVGPEEVTAFLEAYFPVPSRWERRPGRL